MFEINPQNTKPGAMGMIPTRRRDYPVFAAGWVHYLIRQLVTLSVSGISEVLNVLE